MGYRSYSYTELILITDVYVFGPHVGITELMLIQGYLHTYWYSYIYLRSPVGVDRTYTYTTEFTLVQRYQ